MRVIIGNLYYSTIDGPTVQISRSVSDPVPRCTFHLRDVSSTLAPKRMQEVLILDDKVTPNPTVNTLLNPALNPITTDWFVGGAVTGITLTTAGGGGAQWTFSNAANNAVQPVYQYIMPGMFVAGQTYTLSFTALGVSPVNIKITGFITAYDGGQNVLASTTLNFTVPTSSTRLSATLAAPAGTIFGAVTLSVTATSGTNSGTVTITQAQLEPNWIPTLSYPTPWCGPAQTNVQQLPLGYWIRQYRKFAGFVTHSVARDYHGNVRTVQVNCVGYAWLMGIFLANDSFTSQADSAIITTLLGKYPVAQTPTLFFAGGPMLTTTNVITGVTVSNLQSNWDDLRTLFSTLAGLSGFYWTVDYYWNMIYAPPGYFSMQISLICDNSSQPDMKTTFPAYAFSAEQDFTQPGSNILVLGSGSNTAQVIDPSQIAEIGITSGYILPTTTSWMRKVNDSTLASTTDATNRGLAELVQYDYARNVYHLTTNVELIPGQSIQVTSATDSLNQATLLIQQTQTTWKGTDATGADFWEYKSDLGAINRAVSNIISRIFRQTQRGTSAPAIATTTLAVFEKPLNIVESIGSGTTVVNYAQTILPDTPLVLYPLGENNGTIADDISGNAQQGAIAGSMSLGQAGLLTDAADASATSMQGNGTNADISVATGTLSTGNSSWTVEIWGQLSSNPAANVNIIGFGTNATKQAVGFAITSSGFPQVGVVGSSTITGSTAITLNQPFYAAITWDGTTLTGYCYQKGGQTGSFGTATPGALNIVYATFAFGSFLAGSNWWPGWMQYGGVYGSKLTTTQTNTHFAAGHN